ncbi:Hypothetical protein ABZS17D1_02466 [Kosakonia cowanii]
MLGNFIHLPDRLVNLLNTFTLLSGRSRNFVNQIRDLFE